MPFASGKITTFVILPDFEFLRLICVFCLERSSLFSLPILMLSFSPLLWRFWSSSFHVPFRRNYSICSCWFVVSVGGGEFGIFLHHHLEPSLSYFYFCSFLSTFKYFCSLYISFLIFLALTHGFMLCTPYPLCIYIHSWKIE